MGGLKPLPCPFCNSPGARRIVCMTVPASNVMTPLTSCSNPDCPASEVSFTDDEWSGHRSPAWRDDMSEAPRNKDLYLWSRKHGLVVGYFAPGMDHYRKPTAIYKGAHIEFQPTYWQLPLPPEEKA